MSTPSISTLPHLFLKLGLAMAFLSSMLHGQSNLIKDGSFEEKPNKLNWPLYVPPESKEHGATFARAPGEGINKSVAGMITAPEMTRVSINTNAFVVAPGEKFKISFSFRAKPGFEVKSGQPGVLIRVNPTTLDKMTKLTPIFVGPNSKSGTTLNSTFFLPTLPVEWQRSEAIVEMPAESSFASINLFIWQFKGVIYFDNIVVEPMAESAK